MNESSLREQLGPGNPSAAGASRRRLQNDARPVNQLPHELLSRIFIIGEEMQRSKRLKVTETYSRFPLIITRVCSQWRHVAINSPLLWSYVHVDRPPPDAITTLYLRRTGTETPLDLDIEMRSSYWGMIGVDPKDWRRQVDHIPSLLDFLTFTGADTRRWKSLIICVKTPQVFFEFVRTLNAESAPALQFLSCMWKTGMAARYRREEPQSLSDPRIFGDPYSLCGSSFPNLRSVELNAIPWRFVFNRHPLSLFTGVVKLNLTAAFDTEPSVNLYNLLSLNLQLEQLCISSGMGIGTDACFKSNISHVHLPYLRRLEVTSYSSTRWSLCVLRTIDAPNLEQLSLSVGFDSLEGFEVADLSRYIATGKLSDPNPDLTSKPLADKPIYPSLRCLDVSPFQGRQDDFKILFSALASVNRLMIPDGALDLLGQSPWLLPDLVHLGFPNSTPHQLGNVLRRRLEAGFPVKTVELGVHERDEIIGGLPDTVTVADAPIPEFTINLHETDEEDPDDWDN